MSTSEERMHKDGDAIVTSVNSINQMHWKDFVDKHWDSLMVKGTTLLVLTGVHGLPNGDIGRTDHQLVKEDQPMKEHLLKTREQQVKRDNIKIILMDIGPVCKKYFTRQNKGCYMLENLRILKEDLKNKISLWEDIIGRRFTSLCFAYCHTQWNIVADLLRLEPSLCSRLVVERDMFQLFGRKICWSHEQLAVLQWVAKNPTKPVMLTGDYGTGKTLLAAEAVKIKLSHYRTIEGKTVQVIVGFGVRPPLSKYPVIDRGGNASYSIRRIVLSDNQLLKDWFSKQLCATEQCVKFVAPSSFAWDWKVLKSKLSSSRSLYYKATLESMRKVKDSNKDVTIFVMDEADVDLFQGLESMDLKENEDFVISGHLPTLKHLMRCQNIVQCLNLGNIYRNSLGVKRLHNFITTHATRSDVPVETKYENIIDQLPGSMPVWVTVEEDVSDKLVLDYLMNHPEYMGRLEADKFSCTSLNDVAGTDWHLRGAEYPTVIVFHGANDSSGRSLCEAITRARNHLFIITKVSNKKKYCHMTSVMQKAMRHGSDDYDCYICARELGKHDFRGIRLVERAFEGKTLSKTHFGKLKLMESELQHDPFFNLS